LQPEVRQRTSRSPSLPNDARQASHIRRGGSLGFPAANATIWSSAFQIHLREQPLMPQLTSRSLILRATCEQGSHSVPVSVTAPGLGGSGSASGWPCAMSCCCRVCVADRVHPGTVQGICLSSRVSSSDWQAVHRCLGAGLSAAKASSWAVAVHVQVPVQPGRSHLRSRSCKWRDFSRHGSHMPSVAASPSDAPCPSPNDLLESWIQVRVQPGTRQGKDLAPNLSASVNFPAAIRSFVSWQHPFDKASGNSAKMF
jgi:hypothetical protein